MSACDVKSKFKFRLFISGFNNGNAVAGFRKVSGLEMETDVSEFRTGDSDGFCYLPGASKAAVVTLERGVLYGGTATSTELKEWWDTVESSTVSTSLCGIEREVTIEVLDRNGTDIVRTIKVYSAWPSKFALGDLDTMTTEAWVETLELQSSGIKVSPNRAIA